MLYPGCVGYPGISLIIASMKSTHESAPMQTDCGQVIYSCVGVARYLCIEDLLLGTIIRSTQVDFVWAHVSMVGVDLAPVNRRVAGSVPHVGGQDRQLSG